MPSHSPNPGSADADEIDFEQTLRNVEQALLLLKARYGQVQADQHRQQELQQRLSQAERQQQRDRSQALKTELKQVQQQIEELEVALESKLFSWSGLKEVFWQAVRFGGLGVVLGWTLKSLAGS
jgi:predicted RNase H-like nuclease (RuvC/YqgF family)